jgi:glutaredoxin-related protein
MGAVGGGIWHSVKGAKNSPRVGFSNTNVVRIYYVEHPRSKHTHELFNSTSVRLEPSLP